MNRRNFIKAMSAVTAAFGVGVTVKQEPEVYDHWNQPFKGNDRRKYFKRQGRWCVVSRETKRLCSPDVAKIEMPARFPDS